ncbi:MAG: ATP-binding protein [Leucobacter sp.]
MTQELALPVEIDTRSDQAQWSIETLQMVNWGGFHGHREVRFSSEGSTLMSGASGSGKSTVLDAYIALMMSSDTPFNGASNEAGGRARSAQQRNLLTYLRGKLDDDGGGSGGERRDLVLRGSDGNHVWGALGATFVNDQGRRLTVLRLYFVRSTAVGGGDVTTTYATCDGSLDLSKLESLAATRFDRRSLRAANLTPYKTFREFEDTIHTRLGIGGGDGGRKAMRLLARVQAGMEVKRVDSLYRTMVLERPVTYEVADRALEHFADLEASYAKMLDESSKLKTLERLPELQRDLSDAQRRTLIIEQFGVGQTGPTPFQLWRLRTELGLLDAAVDQNCQDRRETQAAFDKSATEEADQEARLDAIAEEKRANGGDAIDARQRQIQELRSRQDDAYAASIRFQERTRALELVTPETSEEFVQAQSDAAEFLQAYDDREEQLRHDEAEILGERAPVMSRRAELMAEQSSLKSRTGMMPDGLHIARVKMAQAAGLDPMEDLPFVGELIDVLPEEESWRKAIETTLGGLARTVLVDKEQLEHLSASIESVSIRPRIRFQAVGLEPHEAWKGDPTFVSGKLAYKESMFSKWVQGRVSSAGVDHECVSTAAALSGRGARVTASGQTRNGNRGAHGESNDGNVIGFSNERRLADIEAELDATAPLLRAIDDRLQQVRERLASLRSQREAHRYVQDCSWTSIDRLGIARRIEEIEGEIARLRENSSLLDELQTQEDRLKQLLSDSRRARILASDQLEKLNKEHSRLVTEQDLVISGIDPIEQQQSAVVTEEQQTYLDDMFASSWDTTSLKSFSANMKALRTRLDQELNTAKRDQTKATKAMEAMFEQYKQRWTEHNLGVTVASADGFREIFDRITSEGLHERRDRWRREFAAWSSDDLLRLNDAFDSALEDIEKRLTPINRILKRLPFGGKGVLQIKHQRLGNEDLGKFRRDLRTLSSGLAMELTDHQVEARFKKLREFMAKISIPVGHTKSSTSQRDRYLDVRHHVMITAVCKDEHGREVATYDSLGGKSGGETQELVAFIVGAALRYQLGDETRSRPRFAPVFLDEGFVKSDSEFAGRAVRAWQSLGFQLIIGAPLDKVTALEPYMDLLLLVTKSAEGYSFVSELKDAPTDDGGDQYRVAV